MIRNWCLDDMGKNVLYKSDGSLRYPDFKLYKMIARNVHYHEPEMELENDILKNILSPVKILTKIKLLKYLILNSNYNINIEYTLRNIFYYNKNVNHLSYLF